MSSKKKMIFLYHPIIGGVEYEESHAERILNHKLGPCGWSNKPIKKEKNQNSKTDLKGEENAETGGSTSNTGKKEPKQK